MHSLLYLDSEIQQEKKINQSVPGSRPAVQSITFAALAKSKIASLRISKGIVIAKIKSVNLHGYIRTIETILVIK